jgi:hypothetical protein
VDPPEVVALPPEPVVTPPEPVVLPPEPVVAPPAPGAPPEADEVSFWSAIVPVTGWNVGFGVRVRVVPETQYE